MSVRPTGKAAGRASRLDSLILDFSVGVFHQRKYLIDNLVFCRSVQGKVWPRAFCHEIVQSHEPVATKMSELRPSMQ